MYAFLILRLFLGLRALFAGIEKWELGGEYSFSNYYVTMGRMADGIAGASFMPSPTMATTCWGDAFAANVSRGSGDTGECFAPS